MSEPLVYIFHRKYFEQQVIVKAITCAYSVNLETGILRYGAYIFNRDNDNWSRRACKDLALNVYNTDPVYINFGKIPESPGYYQYRRLEYYITDVLVKTEGCNGSDPNDTPHYKTSIFNPTLTPEEMEDYNRFNSTPSTPPVELIFVYLTFLSLLYISYLLQN